MGYARAIAADGDLAGALHLLQSLAAKSPTPDLAARMGDLLEKLGRHDEAERQYALAEAGWRVDAPEPKNLARFLADHNRKIDDAVAIAERAAAERHDIFTEDALALAYFKAGRLDDAARASALALRTGSRDREILSHAAEIRQAVGDSRAAHDLIARALPVAAR
jgi:Flp pilus assembly protein TadD